MTAEARIRPASFRHGSDAELGALHRIEIPIQDERGSDRMPRPLDAYIGLARNLPPQFDDHTWIAEDATGPVAVAYCWSDAAGDPHAMECDVLVRRDRRRRQIGSRLFDEIRRRAVDEGRPLLTWSTFDGVPAGAAFSEAVGGRVARTNRTSELELAAVDWPTVDEWARADEAQRLGYTIESLTGPYPPERRADAVTFHRIMQTAPREDLEVGDLHIDAGHVADLDRSLVEAGRTRWTILVRSPQGDCVGGTEVTFEPDDPTTAHQQNTGIDPAHRRLGLARWVKAAMLRRIRDERPSVKRIRTGNAFSNEPMLAINDALGFRAVQVRTEWQLRLPS